MKIDIKSANIFRPCVECTKVNDCPYANNFDEDEALKQRLFCLFKYGEDCWEGSDE